MFNREVKSKSQEAEKKWEERIAVRKDAQKMEAKTAGGIPLKPFYTPADLDGLAIEDIPIPGEYPTCPLLRRGMDDAPTRRLRSDKGYTSPDGVPRALGLGPFH
jgi:hypothetical protein